MSSDRSSSHDADSITVAATRELHGVSLLPELCDPWYLRVVAAEKRDEGGDTDADFLLDPQEIAAIMPRMLDRRRDTMLGTGKDDSGTGSYR